MKNLKNIILLGLFFVGLAGINENLFARSLYDKPTAEEKQAFDIVKNFEPKGESRTVEQILQQSLITDSLRGGNTVCVGLWAKLCKNAAYYVSYVFTLDSMDNKFVSIVFLVNVKTKKVRWIEGDMYDIGDNPYKQSIYDLDYFPDFNKTNTSTTITAPAETSNSTSAAAVAPEKRGQRTGVRRPFSILEILSIFPYAIPFTKVLEDSQLLHTLKLR